MKINASCAGSQSLELPLIQTILKVSVVQVPLKHHMDNRQELPRWAQSALPEPFSCFLRV